MDSAHADSASQESLLGRTRAGSGAMRGGHGKKGSCPSGAGGASGQSVSPQSGHPAEAAGEHGKSEDPVRS